MIKPVFNLAAVIGILFACAVSAVPQAKVAARKGRRGFGPLASASDFRIGSLKISGGTARINFVSTRRWRGWPGDLAPVRFKTAVD